MKKMEIVVLSILFGGGIFLGYMVGYSVGYARGAATGDQAAWLDTARALDHLCNNSCCIIQMVGSGNETRLVINGPRIPVPVVGGTVP